MFYFVLPWKEEEQCFDRLSTNGWGCDAGNLCASSGRKGFGARIRYLANKPDQLSFLLLQATLTHKPTMAAPQITMPPNTANGGA